MADVETIFVSIKKNCKTCLGRGLVIFNKKTAWCHCVRRLKSADAEIPKSRFKLTVEIEKENKENTDGKDAKQSIPAGENG